MSTWAFLRALIPLYLPSDTLAFCPFSPPHTHTCPCPCISLQTGTHWVHMGNLWISCKEKPRMSPVHCCPVPPGYTDMASQYCLHIPTHWYLSSFPSYYHSIIYTSFKCPKSCLSIMILQGVPLRPLSVFSRTVKTELQWKKICTS